MREGGGSREAEPAIRRLVVLVPSLEVDLAEFAARLRSLALPRGLRVLLVGQHPHAEDKWIWRRELAGLAALISDAPRIIVDYHVGRPQPWPVMLQPMVREGDLVVCHREQVQGWSVTGNSLARQIKVELQVPVCELRGLYAHLPRLAPSVVRNALSWAVPLVIILVFGVIQVQLREHTTGWVTTAALFVSVLIELALIAL